jgi:hypothetical protein
MVRPNTHGLTEEHLGKRLRIQLSSGYEEEVLALEERTKGRKASSGD